MKKEVSGIKRFLLLLPFYIFTLLFVFFPLIYMFLISFLERGQGWGVSDSFSLDNYRKLLEPLYLNILMDSLKLALITTILVALIAYPFGYHMAKLSDKAKNLVMLLLLIPFFTGSLIRMNGWIIVFRSNGILDKLLMTLGITKEPLKLLYSYPAVVFGMIYILLPFMILSVYSSANRLDPSLTEAARDLGASRMKAFLTVNFKLTLPGLLSGVVLTFIPSMGLFFIADIMGGNKIVLMGSIIHEQMTKGRNVPFAAALSVILMAMTTFMLFLYSKLTGQKLSTGLK